MGWLRMVWCAAHVTRDARGCGTVVLAHYPGFAVEIHAIVICLEDNAMHGLVVDLQLRMIRAHVAFAAGFRLTGLRNTEVVAAVTGCARSQASVRIHTPHAAVGPTGRAELSISEILHGAAMALAAAALYHWRAFDDFAEHVIKRADELRGLGVAAVFILVHLFTVAVGAILGSYDDGDLLPVMINNGGITGVCFVAGIAVNSLLEVLALFPFLYEHGCC